MMKKHLVLSLFALLCGFSSSIAAYTPFTEQDKEMYQEDQNLPDSKKIYLSQHQIEVTDDGIFILYKGSLVQTVALFFDGDSLYTLESALIELSDFDFDTEDDEEDAPVRQYQL